MRRLVGLLFLILLAAGGQTARAEAVVVGAKKFTESVILAEMAAHLARQQGLSAQVRELGGTRALWQALLRGDIDVSPEYSGTLLEEIFAGVPEAAAGLQGVRPLLAAKGILVGSSLGFSNTYALGMVKKRAAELG